MTIQEALTEGRRILALSNSSTAAGTSSIESPSLDAALLLAEVLATSRERLFAGGNDPISDQNLEKYRRFLERRESGECIAYILGRKEFRGLDFTVNSNVLVPRPDTETLVEAALLFIDSRQAAASNGIFRNETACNSAPEENYISLLDLCTGSGAVAISLKSERPFLEVSASDISPKALDVAKQNAVRLLENKGPRGETIRFINSDLFKRITGLFSIIVSNPPYIPANDIDSLAPEVKREPALALNGGEDGLDLIRLIIKNAPLHLIPGGTLLLEASEDQMPEIHSLLVRQNFTGITLHKDLSGRDRVISGKAI